MSNDLKKLNEMDKKHRAIIAKDGFVPFHTTEAKANRPEREKLCAAAEDFAKRNHEQFMNKVFDHTHPENAATHATYQGKYDCDSGNVLQDFREKAYDLLDARPIELKNNAYENKVLTGYRLATEQDRAFMGKFKDYMKAKWDAVGYKGDEDYINMFWNVHPLSSPNARPNSGAISSL